MRAARLAALVRSREMPRAPIGPRPASMTIAASAARPTAYSTMPYDSTGSVRAR
jgi:hypothetical protein